MSSCDGCAHEYIPDAMDQTLGVSCRKCGLIVGYCWRDQHLAESVWNLACKNDPAGVPCEQDRNDHCFLCGEFMEAKQDG